MSYIQRAITPILKQRVSTSKCMLLVGARQVGKSTLIKHEFEDFNRANFDDRLTRMQAKEEPKLFFLNNPKPLFIDEVQKESSILEGMQMFPQLLKNVRVEDKAAAVNHPRVQEEVKAITEALGDDGRILLRESGTEPVVRVMVEAKTDELCEKYVNQMIHVMKQENLIIA